MLAVGCLPGGHRYRRTRSLNSRSVGMRHRWDERATAAAAADVSAPPAVAQDDHTAEMFRTVNPPARRWCIIVRWL